MKDVSRLFERFRRAPRIVLSVLALLGLLMPPALADQPAPTVVSVTVTGNTHISTDRILAVVRTKVGDPFDPAIVQQDLRAIADLGFFADQAPPVIRQRPDGVAVTFRVIENPVVSAIRFDGNKSVSADTLLALMDTAPGQVFNIKTYQQDVLKINSYYDKIGFGGQVPSHVVDVNIGADGVLTLKIEEGLTVRKIIITPPPDGDPLLPPPVIMAALVTKPGSSFSEEQRDKDYDALKALYEKYDLKLGDVEAGVDPTTIDQKAGTADVRYTISVLRVGAIEITGNTKTHDDVIRRELRLRPGMVVTDAALHRDYDRLNNLGFFEKIDFQAKPGPDPKRPGLVTLNWQVKEQRTGTATLGAGYSGGITGTGLTGNVSYQQNNINGTGDGGAIRIERGARISDAQLSATIPYLGSTPASQRYSLSATLFDQSQTNYYPVYYDCGAGSGVNVPCPTTNIPVAIVPPDATQYSLVSGIISTYKSSSRGITVNLGRRLSDIFHISGGFNFESVASQAIVPTPYAFTSNPGNELSGCIDEILSACDTASDALGVIAPSIAEVNSTKAYPLHSIVVGFGADSRDDVFNPRRGWFTNFSDEVSTPSLGSAFHYDIFIADIARFFPVGKNMTLGFHAVDGTSTGALPTNKLFIFSDQQLRGYEDPFYGTDELLGQLELRIPLTKDRKFSVVTFADDGAVRIRGATLGGVFDPSLANYSWHGDVGVGVRFDVPQLGLHTLRLDFAKGSQGTHTSFGIGQSF
jgi:outer membrane protein assembly factor BamA